MKYLVFNAVVLAALVYLFNDGELPRLASLEEGRARLFALVGDLDRGLADARAPATADQVPREPQPDRTSAETPRPDVATAPAQPAPQRPDPELAAAFEPQSIVEADAGADAGADDGTARASEPLPPLDGIREVPVLEPKPAPVPDDTASRPVSPRPSEGPTTRAITAAVPTTEAPPFEEVAAAPSLMSPRERRRELTDLARSMEDLFLRSTVRE